MSHDLTVFVISCGEEVLEECLASIEGQQWKNQISYKVDSIRDVVPMSEAFNEMHRRSESPYFVQVDADMILKPNALETLYEGARRSPPWVYAVYGQLYEEGFGPGGAIRCWKKSFFRFFQFRDRRTVDRDLYKRARLFGLRRKNLKQVLGTHKPRHSSFSEYLKTKSDVEKWRFLGRPPEKYALPLLEELLQSPEENRFRIFGAMLGAISSDRDVHHSKDIFKEKNILEENLSRLQLTGLESVKIKIPGQLKEIFARAYRGDATELKKLMESAIRN